jgi:nucleoside-diphosphate-sugar epimerase
MQMNSPQNVLIIGGSGFLSGTIARLAVSQGHHVTVVTRGNKPLPLGISALQVDRTDRDAFAQVIASQNVHWDLVVDSIAFSPDDALQDVNVFANRTRRFVLVSTDFVYDPYNRNVPQAEADGFYTTIGYGGKKREAELVLENAGTSQLPWTVLRPSHIYGPGSLPGCLPMHGRDPQLIEHIRAGKPLQLIEGGRLLQHPIFAPDLAATILSSLSDQLAIGKILNVAGPDHFESHAYYTRLGEMLGCPVTIDVVPVDDFLAENPDKAPFCCDRVYDLSALRATDLAIPKTTLDDGLKQMLDALL